MAGNAFRGNGDFGEQRQLFYTGREDNEKEKGDESVYGGMRLLGVEWGRFGC